ncbi:F-actin-capping protein subunit alpha [Sorochytrium milnesiophthora]
MADAARKVAIARELLQDAPPGEFNEVYNDVRKLVGDDTLSDPSVQDAISQYNTDQLTCVKLPDQPHETLVSQVASSGGGRFVDPRASLTYTLDHTKQQVLDVQPLEDGSHNSAERQEVDTAVVNYVKDHYPNGACAVHLADDALHILIVDNKYNPDNYWNGRWRSVWTVAAQGASEIIGHLRLNIHYYEDGNVQLTNEKKLKASLIGTSPDPRAFAAAVVRAIKKAEGDYQKIVNEQCMEMSETTFRLLRRPLPVTKTKVDWNKIANYRIGSELANKAG